MGTKKTISISTSGKKVTFAESKVFTSEKEVKKKINSDRPKLTREERNAIGTRNLKPIKPGEVRNPNGRPKGSTSIKSKLQKLLANYRPPKNVYLELKKKYPQIAKYEDCTIDDAIWARVIDQALNGNENARDFVAERTEGRVVEKVDLGIDVDTIQLSIDTSASIAPEPIQDDSDVKSGN
jgi:hypothetical protein